MGQVRHRSTTEVETSVIKRNRSYICRTESRRDYERGGSLKEEEEEDQQGGGT